MKSLFKISTLTLMSGLFLSASLRAQDSAEDKWNALPEKAQKKMLERGDSDNDGQLSKEERKDLWKKRVARHKEKGKKIRDKIKNMSPEERKQFKEDHKKQFERRKAIRKKIRQKRKDRRQASEE